MVFKLLLVKRNCYKHLNWRAIADNFRDEGKTIFCKIDAKSQKPLNLKSLVCH